MPEERPIDRRRCFSRNHGKAVRSHRVADLRGVQIRAQRHPQVITLGLRMEGLGLEDTEGNRLPGHGLGADVGDEPVEDPAPNPLGDDRGVKRRSHDRGFVHVCGEAQCSGDHQEFDAEPTGQRKHSGIDESVHGEHIAGVELSAQDRVQGVLPASDDQHRISAGCGRELPGKRNVRSWEVKIWP
jgi:hypothetical protein